MNTHKNQVYARCHCDDYRQHELFNYLSEQHTVKMIRTVIQLQWKNGEVFIFDYGVCVFWQVSEIEQNKVLSMLENYAETLVSERLDDEFSYSLDGQQATIKNDHIKLDRDDERVRLAISHGIAQSTKLLRYEAKVQHSINSTDYVPERIATTGKSGLGRKTLAKLRGQLYLTKSDVMLHYDLLDTPNYFWENPELQHYYKRITEYLEVSPRINVLGKKLETIQDLLAMISDEQKHKHSSLLEWIIIWLIALDILFIFWQKFS